MLSCVNQPPGHWISQCANHSVKGIFLGYKSTLSHIIYYDDATRHVKTGLHAIFDEGMHDFDVTTWSSRAIHQALVSPLHKEIQEHRAPSELGVMVKNFTFLDRGSTPRFWKIYK